MGRRKLSGLVRTPEGSIKYLNVRVTNTLQRKLDAVMPQFSEDRAIVEAKVVRDAIEKFLDDKANP